jgi:putative endonuclease
MSPEKLDFSKIPKYYVYVLLSLRDRKFYVGFTLSLKDRIQKHGRGEVRATRHRRPLLLIHYEYFINKTDAKAREVFLKSGFGRKQMRESLKRTLMKYLD